MQLEKVTSCLDSFTVALLLSVFELDDGTLLPPRLKGVVRLRAFVATTAGSTKMSLGTGGVLVRSGASGADRVLASAGYSLMTSMQVGARRAALGQCPTQKLPWRGTRSPR